ncbi:MAG: LamG-like jellyroll fold domain-containing protein, partial [bacterium]
MSKLKLIEGKRKIFQSEQQKRKKKRSRAIAGIFFVFLILVYAFVVVSYFIDVNQTSSSLAIRQGFFSFFEGLANWAEGSFTGATTLSAQNAPELSNTSVREGNYITGAAVGIQESSIQTAESFSKIGDDSVFSDNGKKLTIKISSKSKGISNYQLFSSNVENKQKDGKHNTINFYFTFSNSGDISYVKFRIQTNERLYEDGELKIKYLDATIWKNFDTFNVFPTERWKVFDFTDLQTKNPNAVVILTRKGENPFVFDLELWNATDFDPYVYDTYSASMAGTFNNTFYDTNFNALSSSIDAGLILQFDTNESRIVDSSYYNRQTNLGGYTTNCTIDDAGACAWFPGQKGNALRFDGMIGINNEAKGNYISAQQGTRFNLSDSNYVNSFTSNEKGFYNLSSNSASINTDIPDLNPNTPTQYTSDWDSDGRFAFKIAMNETNNSIQMFINISKVILDDYTDYCIDIDGSSASGGTSLPGCDLMIENIGTGLEIECYNSGSGYFDTVASGDGSGQVTCDKTFDGNLLQNYTIYWNTSSNTTELVVNMTGSWANKLVYAEVAGESTVKYTTFKNTSRTTGDFNLSFMVYNGVMTTSYLAPIIMGLRASYFENGNYLELRQSGTKYVNLALRMGVQYLYWNNILTPNTWVNITLFYNATSRNATIWKDGIDNGTQHYTGVDIKEIPLGFFSIGEIYGPYLNVLKFKGMLDEMYLLNDQNNLVFNFTFDQTNGTTLVDSSGNNNGVTISNYGRPAHNITIGKYQGGYYFDGNDYLDLGLTGSNLNAYFQDGKNFSVGFWADITGTYDKKAVIGSIGNNTNCAGASDDTWWYVQFNNTNLLTFRACSGSTRVSVSTSNVGAITGVWRYYTMTYNDTGNVTLYVDGISYGGQDISTLSGFNNSNTPHIWISQLPSSGQLGGSGITGWLDNMIIYSRTLSASEVLEIYSGNKANYEYLPVYIRNGTYISKGIDLNQASRIDNLTIDGLFDNDTIIDRVIESSFDEYWTFDNNTNSLLSGVGQHDGTSYGAFPTAKGINGSYWFDGISSYILISEYDTGYAPNYTMWINNGSWHFIANMSRIVYVDGEVGSANFPFYSNGTDTYIGKYSSNSYFNGSIDEARFMYNFGYTAEEIKKEYRRATGSKVSTQIRTSSDNSTWSDWYENGIVNLSNGFITANSSIPEGRYLQYLLVYDNLDSEFTPQVNETNLGYTTTTTYCGGAYSSGAWTITTAVSCSNEVIPVDGAFDINNEGSLTLN